MHGRRHLGPAADELALKGVRKVADPALGRVGGGVGGVEAHARGGRHALRGQRAGRGTWVDAHAHAVQRTASSMGGTCGPASPRSKC